MAKSSRVEPLPYYKWHWRDWRANRKVQRMSWQAQGLYRALLDEFWAEGVLPKDPAELADICGCPLEEFNYFWPEILPCWEETTEGLVNGKMDEQRTDVDAARAAKARAGALGGKLSNSFTRSQQVQAQPKHVLAEAKQVLTHAKQVQAQPDIAEHEHEHEERREELPDASHPRPTAPQPDAGKSAPEPLPGLAVASSESSRGDEKLARDDLNAKIDRLFAYYCRKMGRDPTRYTLTDARRKKAQSRLREREKLSDPEGAVQAARLCIDNLAASAYHRENGHIDWTEQIFRSPEEFEKRLNWRPPTANPGGSNGRTSKIERINESNRGALELLAGMDTPAYLGGRSDVSRAGTGQVLEGSAGSALVADAGRNW